MSHPNARYSILTEEEQMKSAADYMRDPEFNGIRPREIPLGLSVYVGDISTAVMASKEAVHKLLLARADSNLRAMRDAAREIEALTRKANTLSDVLDDKIWELQNKDTRIRS